MRRAMVVTLGVIRVTGLLQIVLGTLFWLGVARGLTQVHMGIGMVFVLALWTLAVLSGRAGAPAGMVALALVWGLVLPALGMTQMSLVPGPWHWTIRVLHLLTGLVGMGLAHALAARAGIDPRRGRGKQPPLAAVPAAPDARS